MIFAVAFVSVISSFQLKVETSFFFGLRNIYLALLRTFGRSTAEIFSLTYSRMFSLLSLDTAIVNEVISLISTVSFELSKKREVKARNPTMIILRHKTANVGLTERINQESINPESVPMPKVILFLARIFP